VRSAAKDVSGGPSDCGRAEGADITIDDPPGPSQALRSDLRLYRAPALL